MNFAILSKNRTLPFNKTSVQTLFKHVNDNVNGKRLLTTIISFPLLYVIYDNFYVEHQCKLIVKNICIKRGIIKDLYRLGPPY